MIKYESHDVFSYVLTPEGAHIAKEGSHEARVWAALPAKGQGTPVTPVQLKKAVGDESAKVGQGNAFKRGWIAKEGDGLVKIVSTETLLFYLSIYARRSTRLQTPPNSIFSKYKPPAILNLETRFSLIFGNANSFSRGDAVFGVHFPSLISN